MLKIVVTWITAIQNLTYLHLFLVLNNLKAKVYDIKSDTYRVYLLLM